MTRLNLIWIFACFLATTFALTGCDPDDTFFGDCVEGEGPIVSKTLNVPEFSGVELDIAANVRITQGDDFNVRAEGQENIIDLLRLDVHDDVWKIEFDEKCVRDYDLTIFITMPIIHSLRIDGSGNILGENTFELENISLEINGSGNVQLDLDVTKIDGEIDGSGNVSLEGQANELDFIIDGSGNLGDFALVVDTAIIDINGSGNVSLTVQDSLKVAIDGSGDVFYRGHPLLDLVINGSGKVRDAN